MSVREGTGAGAGSGSDAEGTGAGGSAVIGVVMVTRTVLGGVEEYSTTLRLEIIEILSTVVDEIWKGEVRLRRWKFSFASIEVCRPLCWVQCFEMIESLRPGTYHTSRSMWV